MILSQENIIGLKRLANETLVSEDVFQYIFKMASNILSQHSEKLVIDTKAMCSSKPDVVKECLASILVLLVESSRHNLDSNNLLSTLENYNLNLSRLRKVVDLFMSYKCKFQTPLKKIGSKHPRISDIKWRFDFCVKSSSLEHESREIYFIQIVTEQLVRKNLTEEQLLEKKITFTCSLQQLQELIGKLRDAARLVQSITHSR